MESLSYILKIMYYMIFVISLYFYAKNKYNKNKITKFGKIALIIFSIAFGIYAVICGPPNESIGDRSRYAMRFEQTGYEDFTKKSSFGLYIIQDFLHIFTWDSSALFFTIGFLFCYINLYCYKKTEKETPLFLLLLFMTNYALFGFFAIKQAMALAFANLAFTEYWKEKKWRALLFLMIAILCHESALIIAPCVAIAEFCKKNNKRKKILYALSIITICTFPLLINFIIRIIESSTPWLFSQLTNYLDENGNLIINFNFLTIFKYMPYYIIAVVAIIDRKKLKDEIENYDFLLVLTVFCSIFSLLSMYMYWSFRFGMYFYVPAFILATQIYEKSSGKNKKTFIYLITSILVFLIIKLLIQYYFIYGGIV